MSFLPEARRTYGKTRDCRGCRYWSALNQKKAETSPLRCLCLNKNSKQAYIFKEGREFCPEWTEGEHGAIDDPDNRDVY